MIGGTILPTRSVRIVVTASLACLVWLLFIATESDPMLGQPPIRPSLELVAILSTGVLFVMGGGVLSFALFPGGARATGLHRAAVHIILAFVALYFTLSYYGWDLRAALTTSAILTAALGFAMQPTFSSLISGILLNIDYRLKVGDAIVRGGEAIAVEALGWRTIVGRKDDGRIVVFPNARLADAELEFVPAGAALRTETTVPVSTATSPGRVASIVANLLGDIAELDPGHPIEVAPVEFNPDAAATRYRIRCWVRDYRYLHPVQSQVQVRLWYGLRRHGLFLPSTPGDTEPLGWSNPGAVVAALKQCRPDLPPDTCQSLAEAGDVLLFGAGETAVLSEHQRGRAYLLLSGALVDAPVIDGAVGGIHGDRPPVEALSRIGAERYLAAALASRIGPYAEYAIHHAARDASTLEDLCLAAAEEIEDPGARADFLASIWPARPTSLRPGSVFPADNTVAGALLPHRRLRARGEVALLALPDGMDIGSASLTD